MHLSEGQGPCTLIREMLFDNDVALTAHREKGIQQMINQFAHAYGKFGLIAVKPPVSDHSKCKDLVVADRRLSLTKMVAHGVSIVLAL